MVNSGGTLLNFFMIFLEPLLIPLAIFVVLYIAYFTLGNGLRRYKVYPILPNYVVIVLCLLLIVDAIKEGRNSFILILLLLLGVSIRKRIDETKKRSQS